MVKISVDKYFSLIKRWTLGIHNGHGITMTSDAVLFIIQKCMCFQSDEIHAFDSYISNGYCQFRPKNYR